MRHAPSTPAALCGIVADAAASNRKLAIRGGGSKAQMGAPCDAAVEARIRRVFDPAGIFETGRFLDAAHAD